jgi:hypothetical protein
MIDSQACKQKSFSNKCSHSFWLIILLLLSLVMFSVYLGLGVFCFGLFGILSGWSCGWLVQNNSFQSHFAAFKVFFVLCKRERERERHTHTHTHRMCVCVCVRERERERESFTPLIVWCCCCCCVKYKLSARKVEPDFLSIWALNLDGF